MTSNSLPFGLDIFAQGAIPYIDHYPNDELVRMVINIYLANQLISIPAIIDTGAPWCVLNPLILEDIANDIEAIRSINRPLNIRGIAYTGWLYRVPIHIPALLGKPLDIEATAFIPNLSPTETWSYPNFVGLQGFLDRIRFAVDPSSNMFFFGKLV